MKQIIGKRGFLSYFIVAFGVFAALLSCGLLAYLIIDPTGRGPFPIYTYATSLFSIGLFIWLAFANLTERTEVSLDRLVIRGPFGSHESLFRHVRSVEVLPLYGNTLFFGYNIVVLADLSQPGAKNHAINASIFANRHEMVKAVIEAAYRSNPEVRIDRSLLSTYGRPPYGIFGSTQANG